MCDIIIIWDLIPPVDSEYHFATVNSIWRGQQSWYVGLYVSYCDLCLCTKAQCHLPVRELQSLPILEEHWNTVSMDFIFQLPESAGYDAIMVIVDLVGK